MLADATAKWAAVVDRVRGLSAAGRPVLLLSGATGEGVAEALRTLAGPVAAAVPAASPASSW